MTVAEQKTDAELPADLGKWPIQNRACGLFGLTLFSLVALLVLGIVGGAFWLDSKSGHEFVIEQVEALEPERWSAHRISARWNGSIFSKTDNQVGLRIERSQRRVFFKAGEYRCGRLEPASLDFQRA